MSVLTAAPPTSRTRLARSPDELDELREAWDGLPWADLEADPDFLLAVAALRDDVVRPHVVAVERDGTVAAMAMARLERRRAAARVGGRALARPALRCLTVVHGGAAATDDDALAALVDELWAAVRRGEADAVFLHKVPLGSPLHRAVEARWPRALRPASPPPAAHWRSALPGDYEAWLQARSSRTRSSLRKVDRRLERELGDRLVLRRFGAPEELDELVADLEAVASRSYQRGLGGGFGGTAEDVALLRLRLEQGRARAWVLHLDGRPVAYELGHVFGRTFFGMATGFDPEVGALRIGTAVMLRAVADLCADPAVDAFDFGYGDAEYKRSFSDERWEEVDVTLLGPRPRPLAAGAALAVAATADRAARRVLGEGRVLAHLRRRRRARAQQAVAAGEPQHAGGAGEPQDAGGA